MHVVCYDSEANVTLSRSNDNVEYIIARATDQFIPITVDIYRGGEFLVAFRCRNGSIADGGVAIVRVNFKGRCEDPTVIVRNITASVSLDLHVELFNQTCSTVTIGPQSEYMFSHLSKVSYWLHVWQCV